MKSSILDSNLRIRINKDIKIDLKKKVKDKGYKNISLYIRDLLVKDMYD